MCVPNFSYLGLCSSGLMIVCLQACLWGSLHLVSPICAECFENDLKLCLMSEMGYYLDIFYLYGVVQSVTFSAGFDNVSMDV